MFMINNFNIFDTIPIFEIMSLSNIIIKHLKYIMVPIPF